ncbi:phage capsid protein [Faecalimonas sp.]
MNWGKINIQIFANKQVDLSPGEQARYTNTIMTKLGGANKMPLEGWFAKSQSNNAGYSVFYVGGKLAARDRTSNFNGTDNNFKDVAGVDAGKLITSIRITPTAIETPLWVDDRDFDKSQLNEESKIAEIQVESIHNKLDERICKLFKDTADNKKRTVKDNNNQDVQITVPEGNFFGDKAKIFNDVAQIKAFKRMMRKAKKMAKATNKRICICAGDDGITELMDCDKFTNKDWVNISGETPNQNGEPLQKLCGGYVEELFNFDNVFYSSGSETEGKIIVFVEETFGQDNKSINIKPTIEHISFKKAYFLDVEVSNATELLQGEGFFVFSYKKDTAPGIGG